MLEIRTSGLRVAPGSPKEDLLTIVILKHQQCTLPALKFLEENHNHVKMGTGPDGSAGPSPISDSILMTQP